MPRYKIAYNTQYFNQIFELIQTTDNEVEQSGWSLLKTITTNPQLYRKVIALNRDPDFKWEDVFDPTNIHKMLYVL